MSIASVSIDWHPLPEKPRLSAGEVHLVSRHVPDDRYPDDEDWALLTHAETQRAQRFKFDLHRNRWVAGRIGIKRLLASYLNCDPESIAFGFGEIGKPYLKNPHGQMLSFNYTDSGGHLLYALGTGQELGVDVEYLPRQTRYEGLARRKLSAAEQRALENLPESERELGFLAAWTRKEAYGKALGVGIRFTMSEVTLCEDFSNPKYQLTTNEIGEVFLLQICPPFNGFATLAMQGLQATVRGYTGTDSVFG